MSKHAGGVTLEWNDDQPRPIPICHFDPASLDTLTERCREALADGRPIEPILQQFIALRRSEWMCDGAAAVLAEIVDSKDVRRDACAWAFAVGLYATEGKSGPELARQFGVRKQAFFQQVERILARLGRRVIRLNMRRPEARARMARRNYRTINEG